MARKKTVKVEVKDELGESVTLDLTPDEIVFVDKLFKHRMNQTRAYMECYPESGYDSARSSASDLLAKPNLRLYVRHRLMEGIMPKEEILAGLTKIARGSLEPFVKVTGDGFVYFDFSKEEAMENFNLIKEIESKRTRRLEGNGEDAEEWEDEVVKIKIHDPISALRDLGRYYVLFTDKTDILSGGKPLKTLDEESYNRAISQLVDALGEVVSSKTKK